MLITAGALAQAVIRTGTRRDVEIPWLILVGLGAGPALAPLPATAMAAVPGPRAGVTAGAVNTFRQLGYALRIAVLGEVFRSGLERTSGQRLAAPLSGGQAATVIARSGTARLVHQAFADSLDQIFTVAAGFGLAAAIEVLAFVRVSRPAPAPASDQQTSLAAAHPEASPNNSMISSSAFPQVSREQQDLVMSATCSPLP